VKAWIVSETDPDNFQTVGLDRPTATGRDLLVEVHAVALNPVDTKVRKRRAGKVLGWDASGVVVAVGDQVTGYAVGDHVYYAGDITRPGANTQFHLVDERIVGRKPQSLDHLHAAALPLTALTAWEGLYEQLEVKESRTILVIGSAGGVGSLVVQMAKRLTRMQVIATASRPESAAWARDLGADHVIDHHRDMPEQLAALGLTSVDYIFCCNATDRHFDAMARMIAPQGRIVSIVEPEADLPMGKLFGKKASFSWEFMFAKAMHRTPDMDTQRTILDRVSQLVDAGVLRCTLQEDGGALSAEGLALAHRRQAAGTMIGKIAFWIAQD
jgi:NADPH2:quinone reductase